MQSASPFIAISLLQANRNAANSFQTLFCRLMTIAVSGPVRPCRCRRNPLPSGYGKSPLFPKRKQPLQPDQSRSQKRSGRQGPALLSKARGFPGKSAVHLPRRPEPAGVPFEPPFASPANRRTEYRADWKALRPSRLNRQSSAAHQPAAGRQRFHVPGAIVKCVR